MNIKPILILSIVVFSSVIIGSITYLYRNNFTYNKSTISVKGLGESDFESNKIIWEGTFQASSSSLENAFLKITNDKEVVTKGLIDNVIKVSELVFGAVTTSKDYQNIYNNNGLVVGREFVGYQLSQTVRVESFDVEVVENAARNITSVLNKGVHFYSEAPKYFYTHLKELKLDLIAKATADAKSRAEIITSEAGTRIGDLISANMGVLQIVGQYSDEDYSWGGAFNTSSKLKTASITIDLTYELEN